LLVERFWPVQREVPLSRQDAPATELLKVRDQAAASAAARKSIAVLPFDNRSADASDEFFVEGIHDDILTQLAKIGSLKVISRTSVMEYKDTQKKIPQIADELGVATVLEGGVQRAGERVRINVQLIDAGDDEHLWAETYDRELTAANIFAIQTEIATTIAEALRTALSPEERSRLDKQGTDSLEAYELYVEGRALFHRRGPNTIRESVAKLEQAVAIDPDFAAAWSALASAYTVMPSWTNVSRDEADPKGRAAARRAIELDPSLGEPRGTLAGVNEEHGHWIEAEAGFREALALEPNNANVQQWHGELLSDVGQLSESIAALKRAEALDPVSPIVKIHLGYVLMAQERHAEGRAVAERTPDVAGARPWAVGLLALIDLREGRVMDARERVSPLWGEYPWLWPEPVLAGFADPAERGGALEFLGRADRWENQDPFFVLMGYALLDDPDGLFAALAEAFARKPVIVKFLWQPEFARMRRDPRFAEFIRASGLPAYWERYGWGEICEPSEQGFVCS
jgi:TolB-like protein/Tfp pilus assembly protein PilF